MDIFVTDDFDKFMRKNRIFDQKICVAAQEIMHGRHDGDLGGGVLRNVFQSTRVNAAVHARWWHLKEAIISTLLMDGLKIP